MTPSRPTPDARTVLEERARLLARPVTPRQAGDVLELITFALANETYALESRFVLEVFRLMELSPLPGADPPVRGVTSWRGALLTILDLRAPLGLSVGALHDLSRVIVVGEARAAFGILIDAIGDLIAVSAAEIRPPREHSAAQRIYVRGITAEAILVLDAAALLRLQTEGGTL